MRIHRKTLKWAGFYWGKIMKTYQVWLVLEETENDSPQCQLETCQVAVTKSEKLGQEIFSEAQELISDLIQ